MKSRQGTGRWAVCVHTAGVAAAWLCLAAAPALAQQVSPTSGLARVYVGAAGLFANQPGTSLGEQTGDTSLEGSGFAVSGLLGAGSRLSVEAEVVRGPELEGLVEFHVSGGTATYASTFRDTLVSAFVRYRGSPSARLLVEPVGGVTLAFGSGTLDSAFVPDGSNQPEFPSEQDLKRRSLGVGGGLDLLLPVGGPLALGGGFRLHRLIWNDEQGLDAPNLGLGRWTAQAGVSVRVNLAHKGDTPGQPAGGRPAAAPAKLRGYVGGFAGLFVQPVGEVDGHYLTEGIGGNGFGFGGTAGAFIHPHWSAAAEVAVGPEFEAQSSFAGRIRFDTRYRDTLISGLFRWHPTPSAPVSLEPVFGGTVAAGHAPRTRTWIDWSGRQEEPTDATITRISFGAVGGADLVAGRRVAAVASIRLHWLGRNDARNDQPPELGVGRFVYIIAGGLRWTF